MSDNHYTIYHTVGIKIGCTNFYKKRCRSNYRNVLVNTNLASECPPKT